MLKGKFKEGDYIMYRGHKYEITKVSSKWYDVNAIPPYDYDDGIVTGIGPGGEDNMTLADKDEQMTVAEFIWKLQKFNPEAKVCIGDNFYNRVSIGWGYSEGCTKENCEYVCLDNAGQENKENKWKEEALDILEAREEFERDRKNGAGTD